jgi:CrcB protein
MIRNLILIGLGGFIGSIARYLVSRLNVYFDVLSVPVGTLLVNVLGSFLIGFLTGIADKSALLTVQWRMFLMVGFCGGFTTFSTFSSENLMLMHNGQYFSVILYTGLSVFLGFTAVFLGFATSNIL